MKQKMNYLNTRFIFSVLISILFVACKKDTPDGKVTPLAGPADPAFEAINHSQSKPGKIVMSLYPFGKLEGHGSIYEFNDSGKVLRKKRVNGEGVDFRKWEIAGKTRYTYIEFEKGIYQIPGAGYVPGAGVILDENWNEIKRVKLLPHNGRTNADVDALDGHEFILLSDNRYIAMAYFEATVANIPDSLNPAPVNKIVDCIIQEVENDQVIFEWRSSDYPELYGNSSIVTDYSDPTKAYDYAHVNSVFVCNDNNLLLSMRNTDQIIKIDRTNGDILWKLGGKNSDFSLSPDQVFLKQHNATFLPDDKTILIFDNGDDKLRPYTRILELELDEASKTVVGHHALNLPDNLFCQFMGSVQKIDGHYFIGCGSKPLTLEIDATTGEKIFELKSDMVSYRAFKY